MTHKKGLTHKTYKKKNKKTHLFLFVLTLFFSLPHLSSASENPLFSKTHLLPSPFTLSQGTLIYGTYFAYGVTDFFQIGTNILKDIYQIYNADAKLSLIDYYEIANAFTFSIEYKNLNNLSSQNKDIYITSYQPGTVFALALHNRVALFLGGHLNFSSIEIKKNDLIETSGFIQGTTLQTDLSFMYNGYKKTKSDALIVGNTLSVGATYDTLFEILGLGISHHWSNFQLGVHYYINADQNKVLPIIAGGGSMSF